jgi:hypothetical protein
MCLEPKKIFLVKNMERLSTLNVSFGIHDIGTVTVAGAVLFHCSMIFLNLIVYSTYTNETHTILPQR